MSAAQCVGVLIISAVIMGIAALVQRYQNRQKEPEQYDTAELAEAIGVLARLADQLDNCDRMLADLAACEPRSLLRGFRVNWCGIDGKRRGLDFLATGRNNATAGLRQAAQEERDRVNGEIIDLIRAMSAALDTGEAPALTLDVVGETVDETAEPVTVGEW